MSWLISLCSILNPRSSIRDPRSCWLVGDRSRTDLTLCRSSQIRTCEGTACAGPPPLPSVTPNLRTTSTISTYMIQNFQQKNNTNMHFENSPSLGKILQKNTSLREAIIRKKFYFTKKFRKTVAPPPYGFYETSFFFGAYPSEPFQVFERKKNK